ncbi:MAG: flagellar basal body P-ring formation chaperone FlgA [Planctomycetota bacterium]
MIDQQKTNHQRKPKGMDALAHTKTNLTRRGLLLGLLTLLLIVWAVGLANGQTVHLKRQAAIDAAQVQRQGGVTLGDVAELSGLGEGETAALRSLIVVPDGPIADRVTLADVRSSLRQAGVNLGLLTLRGFAECELLRDAEPAAIDEVRPSGVQPSPGSVPQAAAALPAAPLDLRDASTVRGLIEARVRAALNLPAEQVVCIFDGRDDATINQSTLGAAFEIEPIGDVRLGRMNFRVKRTAGFGEPTRETVGVRVGWKTRVVTATRDIAKHERLSEANLALVEVTLERGLDGELFALEAVRGAVAAATVRAGRPVLREDLGRPTLVKRGQAVTVRVRRGNFEMTTTAFADHDAALHEPVTLRNQARRTRDTQTFRAYVTGPARVTVRPENPSDSPESTQLAHGG